MENQFKTLENQIKLNFLSSHFCARSLGPGCLVVGSPWWCFPWSSGPLVVPEALPDLPLCCAPSAAPVDLSRCRSSSGIKCPCMRPTNDHRRRDDLFFVGGSDFLFPLVSFPVFEFFPRPSVINQPICWLQIGYISTKGWEHDPTSLLIACQLGLY